MYEEHELKKGLLYLYTSTKKDIPNFSYLIKVIESGIEEQGVNHPTLIEGGASWEVS
ncbi:MAG: hypothetical protein ACRC0F_09420 [Cetobacterium sp.]